MNSEVYVLHFCRWKTIEHIKEAYEPVYKNTLKFVNSKKKKKDPQVLKFTIVDDRIVK